MLNYACYCLAICRYAYVFTIIAISSCWTKKYKTFKKMWIVIRFHTVHGCGSSRKQEINLNEIRKLICSTRLVGPPRQIYFSISWLIKNSTDWGLNERQVTLPCDPSTYSSIPTLLSPAAYALSGFNTWATVVCIIVHRLACLWSKMPMFQWAGMREGVEPLPLAF